MLSVWTHHIKDPEEKIAFEKRIQRSSVIYNTRLREILTDMLTSLENQELSVKAYDSPNWQFRQADVNGFKRAVKKMLTITDLDQREQHERPDSTTNGTNSATR